MALTISHGASAVLEKRTTRPETSSGIPEIAAVSVVDVINLARGWVIRAAGPRGWDDTRETWLGRAARRLGLKRSRARQIFYREIDDLKASEFVALLAKAQEIDRSLEQTEKSNDEIRARLDGALLSVAIGQQLQGLSDGPASCAAPCGACGGVEPASQGAD